MNNKYDSLKEKEIKKEKAIEQDELKNISGGNIFDDLYKRYSGGKFYIDTYLCNDGCSGKCAYCEAVCYDPFLSRTYIDLVRCIRCGTCITEGRCENGAIKYEKWN